MPEIPLIGLDGSNLLAYLAALGTLRVLTLADPRANVRIGWIQGAYWTPVIHHSYLAGDSELIGALAARVCGEATIDAAWCIGDDLTLSAREFAGHLRDAAVAAKPSERSTGDFLAAFGSEASKASGNREQMPRTKFRCTAGQQQFLKYLRLLAAGTQVLHLRRALFSAWDYADEAPSLRWDPADYRPHALRAQDPAGGKDPIRTMRAANRLAVEALPLFPTVPTARRLCTVAFADAMEEVAWPIWSDPLRLRVVASLLASAETQEASPAGLANRGIAQIYRARRFSESGSDYRNFTFGRALL